jgi:hypothetical protein
MGEVVIELPIEVNRRFRITDAKVAARVLEDLEHLERVPPPLSPVTDEEVLTLWANRPESPDEIARQLRHGNGHTQPS